jgi:catechol 2,3-dioxygenase-like lactoylglutathione lyase family enzyme
VIGTIGHVALVVSDPPRTADLFQQLFDAGKVTRVDEEGHDEIFVQLGGIWFVLVRGNMERPRTGDHVAFHVTKDVMDATAAKLDALGLEYMLARSDSALYFFDYDNHVFELDTTDLAAELRDCQMSRD